MSTDFLFDGDENAAVTILLAHGAGAPMDSGSMTAATRALASHGIRIARFEFGYIAARRQGERKPPPRAETLIPEYGRVVAELGASRLVIGGKSMGGRVASMLADELFEAGRIAGLLCVSYPFHPPAKPDQLRTGHLEALKTPTLIVQGTRDPFGTQEDVAGYRLSGSIEMLWLEDGDHDLKPRKSVSGLTAADHLETLGSAVSAWCARL